MFAIDTDYAGGNVLVNGINGDEVRVAPDLRDTDGFWFYYNFRVSGAEGRELTFRFDKPIVSPFGPGISFDGKTWRFLPERIVRTPNSFSFRFAEKEREVWFAFSLPYQWERLKTRLKDYRAVAAEKLCLSEKGRTVYALSAGKGKTKIVLSCRHHCCETTASYVLEGMLDGIDADVRLREKFSFLILPFADLDGAEAGDQGKNRKPHDHNRDYTDNPLYNSVRAWSDAVRSFGPRAALDLHSPWLWGDKDDHVSVIYNRRAGNALDAFAELLGKATQNSPFRHERAWDIRWNVGWNTNKNGLEVSANDFYSRCGAEIACGIEIPYFGTELHGEDDFKRLGKDILTALDEYFA